MFWFRKKDGRMLVAGPSRHEGRTVFVPAKGRQTDTLVVLGEAVWTSELGSMAIYRIVDETTTTEPCLEHGLERIEDWGAHGLLCGACAERELEI